MPRSLPCHTVDRVPRDLGDLDPEEWMEAMRAVAETDAVLDDNTVLVRSHVWHSEDDRYIWAAFVPGTEHGAWGDASTIPACYEAIDEKLVEWYPEASDPATRMTVARIVPEERPPS